MAGGRSKNIHVVKTDNGWAGKREGASRASVTGNTQAEVTARVREIARREQGEMFIHRADNGQIRDRSSYGNDDFPPEG